MDEQLRPQRSSEPSIESNEQVRGMITACVTDASVVDLDENSIDWSDWTGGKPAHVNFFGNPKEWDALQQKHAGEGGYVISNLDTSNKFSDDYADCLGLLAIGQEGGKNISLLTHQVSRAANTGGKDPERVQAIGDKYIKDLTASLHELALRAQRGSVDVVLFGGSSTFESDYRESVKKMGALCVSILGVDPTVIVGPKDLGGMTQVVCDTKRRRLYLTQPGTQLPGAHTDLNRDAAFKASEIDAKNLE